MKNFKKLFAVAASVMMLASTVPTAVLGAGGFSDELQGAYDYAYGIGVTTQSSIENANMYGTLIRSHMAKMMVNYAEEVKGMTPDTDLECEFTDIANQTEELQGYIKTACQLGLMGQGITAFNPNGVVTRAQFGTVLSRVLYGDANNGGDPYYADHLAALQDAGIMNNISNPNAPEVRGYVMLMMQRAAGDTNTPAICDTPENVLSCSLGLDTCPSECVTTTVKEGDLNISSIGVGYTSIPKDALVKFGSMKLDAAGADITVNSVKIKRQGLSSLPTSVKVFFEKDGVRISGRASFNSDDNTATVTFTTPLVVKTAETVDVMLDLTGNTSTSAELQLVSTTITSSAQTVNGNFSSPILRTTDYVVGVATIGNNDYSDLVLKASDEEVKLWEFTVTKAGSGTNRAYLVQAVTLNNSGRADLATYLEDVVVYRDNVKVSTKTTIGTKAITFLLNNEILSTDSDARYVIKGKVTGVERIDADVEYDFYIKNKEDIKVIEKDTQFRTTTNTTTDIGTINVNGGDLKFVTNDFTTLNVTPGSKKVVFYDGYLETNQDLKFENLNVTGSAGTENISTILENLYFKVGSTVISVDELANAISDSMKFEGEFVANGRLPVTVYGDVKSNYTGNGYIKFDTSITADAFDTVTYVFDDSNAKNSNIGSIAGKRANVKQADLSISNSSSTDKNVQRSDRNVELAKIEFTTNSDVVSKVESFDIAFAGTGVTNGRFNGAQVMVYAADGTTLLKSATINGTTTKTITLSTPLSVSKSSSLKFVLKLDQVPSTVSAASGDVLVSTLTGIQAREIINNKLLTSINGQPITMTKLVVVDAGTPEIVTELPTASLYKYGTEVVLGNVKLKAKNGNVTLKNVIFKLTGAIAADMDRLSAIKLSEVGTTNSYTLQKTGTNLVYADNVNIDLTSTIKSFQVKAFVSDVTNSANVINTGIVSLFINTGSAPLTTFTNVFGSDVTNPLTNETISAALRFVKEIPTVVTGYAYTRGNDVVYKVVFNSATQVKLVNLKLSVLQSNLSGAIGTHTVYVAATDNDYDANNYGTGTVTNAIGAAGINVNNINVAGDTTIFVVIKDLATLVSTNDNNPYTKVELTNITYKDIFETGETTNSDMMSQYKAAIIGSLNLNSQVSW